MSLKPTVTGTNPTDLHAPGVLRPHARSHAQIVGAIERRLARGRAEVALHDAPALHFVVGFVLQRLEFLNGLTRPRDDFFVLRQFRLAPDAGIRGVLNGRRGWRDDGVIPISVTRWMGHCYHHALSSVKKWGGTAEDYLPLHQWFDESKTITADFRHRALRHHAEGIFMLERFFGPAVTISTGRVVPVRLIGEQHVREDLGFIPSFADWVRCIRPEPWMGRAQPIHRDVDPFAAAG